MVYYKKEKKYPKIGYKLSTVEKPFFLTKRSYAQSYPHYPQLITTIEGSGNPFIFRMFVLSFVIKTPNRLYFSIEVLDKTIVG